MYNMPDDFRPGWNDFWRAWPLAVAAAERKETSQFGFGPPAPTVGTNAGCRDYIDVRANGDIVVHQFYHGSRKSIRIAVGEIEARP